jgi:tetratricopeptide (TPR) repeat protein
MELGKLNDAVEIFEEVIKTDKNYFDAYYYLGEAYGKLENLGDAHFYLGLFYNNKRDLKNTRFHLSRALKSLKDEEKQRRARKILDSLPRRRPTPPN